MDVLGKGHYLTVNIELSLIEYLPRVDLTYRYVQSVAEVTQVLPMSILSKT